MELNSLKRKAPGQEVQLPSRKSRRLLNKPKVTYDEHIGSAKEKDDDYEDDGNEVSDESFDDDGVPEDISLLTPEKTVPQFPEIGVPSTSFSSSGSMESESSEDEDEGIYYVDKILEKKGYDRGIHGNLFPKFTIRALEIPEPPNFRLTPSDYWLGHGISRSMGRLFNI